MFEKARAFFQTRGVIEVDCPALWKAAPIDLHIDVMQVCLNGTEKGYLHTSPEYGMKRLLSLKIGDIYQISHVFRDKEVGPLHNPEFTMAEWYRIGFTYEEMIEETLAFIHLFLSNLSTKKLSYREVFKQFLEIDSFTATSVELLRVGKDHALDLPKDAEEWDKDTLLQLLMGTLIEPKLGIDCLFVLTDFPATQAALSKISHLPNGESIACRFEIYHKGIELANGFHELTDPKEQRSRLEKSNADRLAAGKEALPIDYKFLLALEQGVPDCSGVAVGFDRLMMLKHNLDHLTPILSFSWAES